jgi:hypothetical protein
MNLAASQLLSVVGRAAVSVVPSGLDGHHFNAFPGLKAWAILRCSFGTLKKQMH